MSQSPGAASGLHIDLTGANRNCVTKQDSPSLALDPR
jgi:hypothetical protein